MSEHTEAPQREDVEILAREITELKEVLRDVSGKLGRMEKRLRLFFPASFPSNERREGKKEEHQGNLPAMTSEQRLALYSELLELGRSGQQLPLENRLEKISTEDLALLVKELGAPVGKKPSRIRLTKSLMGRLKQSVMLSRHAARPSLEAPATEKSPANAADASLSSTEHGAVAEKPLRQT